MGPDAARIATEVGGENLNELGYFRVGSTEIGTSRHAMRSPM